MKKCFEWIEQHFENLILTILLVLITVIMFTQVVCRYLIGFSFSWAEEFCRFCFIFSGFLGLSLCVREGKMLRIDVLLDLMPGKTQRFIDIAGQLLSLLFFGYIFYYGVNVVLKYKALASFSPALRIPNWVVYCSLPFSFGLAFIRQVQKLLALFKTNNDADAATAVEKGV